MLHYAPRRLQRVCMLLIVCILTTCALGCVTSRQLGDEALAGKRYQEALTYYDQEIEEGSRDPELFYNAAQASLNQGDFGSAERYYSRALRYGGDVKVMRALAKLYIQTSNYARASQVLYELLRLDPDEQMVYTNLGTALLYSGQPSEAEAILFIAQQLDPKDPVPYLSLGVLYDRHLISPQRSAAFYTCYLELSDAKSPQRRLAESRIRELLLSMAASSGSVMPLRCGESYVPGDYVSEPDRRKKLQALKLKALKEDNRQIELFEGDDKTEPKEPAVESKSNDPQENARRGELVREAYLSSKCDEVAELATPELQDVLVPAHLRMVADCYTRLKRTREAERTWLYVLRKEPSSGDLTALFDVMGDGRSEEVHSLCKTYSDLLTLQTLQERCKRSTPTTP